MKPGSRPLRRLRSILLLLLLLLLLVAGLLFALGREATLQAWLPQVLRQLAPADALQVSGIHGSLWGPLRLERINWREGGKQLEIRHLELDWQPSRLLRGQLHLTRLQAETLRYRATASTTPAVLPQSLALPLALQLPQVQIGSVHIDTGSQVVALQQLRLALASRDGFWQLQGGQVSTPWGKVQLDASLGQQAPFPLKGQASLLDGTLPLQLSGNLSRLHLAGKTVQHQASIDGKADLTPFEAFPLRALQLKVAHLNPALWQAAAPHADLNLLLDANSQSGQWQGQLRLDNAASGLLDQQRLPLKHLFANVRGNQTVLQLQDLIFDFGNGGQLRGQLDWDVAMPLKPKLALQTTNLNLQGLQSTLRATRIAGHIGLQMEVPIAAGRKPSAWVSPAPPPAQAAPVPYWTLRTELAQQGLQLHLVAYLNAARLQLQQVRLVAGQGRLQLAGEVDLTLPRKFAASGHLQHFDPSWFGKYPAADLNAALRLQGQLDDNWQIQAEANLQPSRLLQQDLLGSLSARANSQRIDHLDLALRFGANSLRAQGAIGTASEQLHWQLSGTQLQPLGWAGQVQAQGVVSGGMQQARSTLLLNMNGLRRASAAGGERATLQAQGEVGLTPQPGVNLSFDASHLNPAAWGAYPLADLSGKGRVQVQGGERWQGGIRLESLSGSLLDKPLAGHLALDIGAQQLRSADLALSWGRNQFRIRQQGMPDLATNAATGVATTLATRNQPSQMNKQALVSATAAIAEKARTTSTTSSATPAIVLDWQIDAPQLLDNMAAVQASGRWQGTLASHTLTANVAYGKLQADFTLEGKARLPGTGSAGAAAPGLGMSAPVAGSASTMANPAVAGWQGSLLSLRASGGVVLQAPMPMQWNQQRQAFTAQRGQIRFDGGNVTLDLLEWQAQQWRSRGHAHGVPLAVLASLNPAWQARLAGGLRLGAEWDWVADEHVNGRVQLVRESGDWQPGIEIPQGLGLQTLIARLNVQQDKLAASLDVRGTQIGQLQAGISSVLARRDGRWGLPGSSPLQLQASARLDSLAPLAGLSNGQISGNGSLTLQASATGTVGNPHVSGTLAGDQLGLNWAAGGLQLKNGGLRAQWRGQTLQIEDLHFDGVAAKGNLRFEEGRLAAHLALTASNWLVLAQPDRVLEVSGQAEADLGPAGLRLSGKLKAERAMLELVAQDAPVRSQDIRLLRGKEVVEQPNATLPLNVQLELDLGEQFRVRGQGLDARLAGKLRWQALERRGPRLAGEVQVVEGSYRAYGQKLLIERGAISFSGAWDNPGLNILAMRQRQDPETEVDVGVELRGSLLAPQVRLVSTPALPDSEKLAWLVLGHGLEGAAGQELDVLGAASSAFFGSTRDNVANRLGLDELGVSYAKGLENAVFTLGKRLSKRAYLSFEQGLGSATGLVKLRYTLNPRVSVQLQTGSNNAVDVFYSWRFD